MELKDKSAIVTGASSGIGRAIALTLARRGASIVVHGRNPERTQETANEIMKGGGRALPVLADISQEEQVREMVGKAIAEFGKVDILVNNAVYSIPDSRMFHETTSADWEPHFNITLKGPIFCCHAVIPHMIDQGGGRIINLTTEAARIGMTRVALYAACKGAIASFSRIISKELGPYGILVNCVSPGVILTPPILSLPQKARDAMAVATSVGHLGEPQDIASMVAFLASDEAMHITGQQFSVNGGSDCF